MTDATRKAAPRCALGAIVALAVLLPGAARATVPDIVAQDDATVVCRWHDYLQAISRMRAAGFSHIRINVIHAAGPDGVGLVACAQPATLADYDAAVAAVREQGLIPQLTLVWAHAEDPGAIAAWMGAMAAHFAPEVQRFSVLNEPDLSIPASDDCDPETEQQLVSNGVLRLSSRPQFVKRYLRRSVLARRNGRIVKAWRYVYRIRSGSWSPRHGPTLARVRAYRWVRNPDPVVKDERGSSQAVTTVRQGCLKVQRGRKYHRIFDAAEPLIRSAAPGAQVLAGETSPGSGLDLFIGQALPLRADGWAHHCYQWNLTPSQSTGGFGVGDTPRLQALVGMPLYYTECGYPNPDSQWNQTRHNGFFTHDNLAGAYSQMWRYAKDQGVREMSQFGWCASPVGLWDTSLMASGDCGESAEYRTLRDLIGSWR